MEPGIEPRNKLVKVSGHLEIDPDTGEIKLIEDDPNKYKCNICYKSFVKKSYWKQHVKSHTVKFECEICHNKFTHHHHLNQHMKTHDDSINHICEVCGAKMKYKFNMVKHMKKHIRYYDQETGEIQYFTPK
jgi:uncharacterized Zn-finger protein